MTDWRFLYNRFVHHLREADGLKWDFRGEIDHYEPFLNKFILQKHDTFIDIGANIGAWSIRASPYYRRVVAFEPNKKWFRSFLRNLKLNHIENVQPWNYGLSNYEGVGRERAMPAVEKDDVKSGLMGMVDVTVKRLDDIFVIGPDAVVKIDTEGAAYRIIKGGRKHIEEYHPRIILEVHTEEESKVPELLPDYSWQKLYRLTDSWVWKVDGKQLFLVGQ